MGLVVLCGSLHLHTSQTTTLRTDNKQTNTHSSFSSSVSSAITVTGAMLSDLALKCRKLSDNFWSKSFTRSSVDLKAPAPAGGKLLSRSCRGAASPAASARPFCRSGPCSETALRSPTLTQSSSKCARGAAISWARSRPNSSGEAMDVLREAQASASSLSAAGCSGQYGCTGPRSFPGL